MIAFQIRFVLIACILLTARPIDAIAQSYIRNDQLHFTWVHSPIWYEADLKIPPVIINLVKKGTNSAITCNLSVHSAKYAASRTTQEALKAYNRQGIAKILESSGAESVKVHRTGMIKLMGRDAFFSESSFLIRHVNEKMQTSVIHAITTRHDLVYTLTCSTPTELFQNYENELWEIISGFSVDP